MTGIHTLEDLRDRCFVDDITGCWRWRGATSRGQPCLWLPIAGKRTTIGKSIGWLLTGEEPKEVWHCTCDTKACGNPEHRTPGDRRSQMLAAKVSRTLLQRYRMSRNRVSRLNEAAAAAIRASDEPLRVVAARHGVSISTCSHIRRGEQWREMGASAFSTWVKAA